MKNILSVALKTLFSVGLTVVLLEIGLRLFPGVISLDLLIYFNAEPRGQIARARGLPTSDDVVPLERDDGGPELDIFKPFTKVSWPIQEQGVLSVVTLDEMGFCNPPQSYQQPHLDLITLGDSFTECHAIQPDQAWASQLSKLTGLSMYNLGKGGLGIHEYLQIFKKFGLAKSPRIVIMNIYEGNDFRDAWRYYQYRQRSARGEIQPTPTPTASLIERYSYAYNLADAVQQYMMPRPQGNVNDTKPTPAPANFHYRLVFADQTIPWNLDNTDIDEVGYARRLAAFEIDNNVFVSIEAALTTFAQLSQEHNFVPVITYTPSTHTAYAANVIFEDPVLSDLMPWFSRMQRQYLKELSQKLGYHFIDLTPALQAAAQAKGSRDLLYYRYDLHLTPSGHAVVAEAINQALRDLAVAPR